MNLNESIIKNAALTRFGVLDYAAGRRPYLKISGDPHLVEATP